MTQVCEAIRFFVGGDEYTNKQLLVTIPNRYKALFDGARFTDMKHFSQALGLARCAQEAENYKAIDRFVRYERSLKNCFESGVNL